MTTAKRTSTKRTTTADERETAAQAQTEKLEALHASLAEQVEALATSAGWQAMLEAASRFTKYSLNNQLLLSLQLAKREMTGASRVAGFATWKALGRSVRKGERGLAVIAPCVYGSKAVSDTEPAKPADDSKHDDKRRGLRGFRIAYVFAESQTEGDDVPDIRPTLLPGEAPHGLWNALSALVTGEGYAVERGDCGGANGFTDKLSRVVRVRDDVSEAQAVKTLAHEAGHVFLHCADAGYTGCRDSAEIEAESVAFIVSAASGLNSACYTTAYVAGWSGGDVKKVRATAERVVATAGRILALLAEGQDVAPVVGEAA